MPEPIIVPVPLTTEESTHAFAQTLRKIRGDVEEEQTERLSEIEREFKGGFELARKYERSVSIYGSASALPGSIYYEKARSLGKAIATELKYAVVTGGGPGIMEAANYGAKEAGGASIGFTIHLPNEQRTNAHLTEHFDFYYFFVRKVFLSFSAEACVFFPGGFGTLDELFETLTLIQTHKVAHRPVILVGSAYWKPLHDMIKENLLYNKLIKPHDVELYKICDDEKEIVDIIRNAPIRVA